MGVGIYEEPLSFGGKLKVTETSWEIFYYFPGPDLRYNGTIVTLPSSTLQQHILALRENWNEYEMLKSVVPEGGEFSKQGKFGMTIRVGKYAQGVCMRSHYLPINTVSQLESLIESYNYAVKRAPQIQQFLVSLKGDNS